MITIQKQAMFSSRVWAHLHVVPLLMALAGPMVVPAELGGSGHDYPDLAVSNAPGHGKLKRLCSGPVCSSASRRWGRSASALI